MKKAIPVVVMLAFLVVLWLAKEPLADPEQIAASETVKEAVTEEVPKVSTEYEQPPQYTDPTSAEESTQPKRPVLVLTEEETNMLLKIGMAERGEEECTECIALVMRTVLNRVETGEFGDSIESVLRAGGQFTPMSDGTYYRAVPNENCYEALDWVINGWDESEGALYYEFCATRS